MPGPAMLILDDEALGLDELRSTLHRRYGQEYLVVCESSKAAALDPLDQCVEEGRPVAIVYAPAGMLETGGAEFLATAHRLDPTAKRVLIVPRVGSSAPSLRMPAVLLQDQSVAQPVLRAVTIGVVDTYLAAPHRGREEAFHLATSELLEEWASDTRRAHSSCVTCWLATESRSSS
jgi:hypothetical protein